MDNIQIEQKRAELQVKLTILKENYANFQHKFEESNGQLAVIAQKSQPYNRVIEEKNNQIELLQLELNKGLQSLNGLKSYCTSLLKEKEKSEADIENYNQCYVILKAKNEELKAKLNSLLHHNDASTICTTQDIQVKGLQRQIDTLNTEIKTLEEDYDKDNKESIAYDKDIKELSDDIEKVNREISMNKENIGKRHKETKELSAILTNLNKINIQINASMNIIQASLNKKAAYLQHDKDYFDACIKHKRNMINTLREAAVYINTYDTN